MVRNIFIGVVLATSIGNGLVGGAFFAFSSFIMPALARLPPAQGIAAMQAINIAVVPSAFIVVFLLSALLSAGLVTTPFWRGTETLAILTSIAGVIGLIGSFGVTMVFNVPLNDRLAAATADAALWAEYLGRWTWWNSVRAVAATASSALLLATTFSAGTALSRF